MTLGLANRWTWLQVYSVIVNLIVYQIPNVCLALIYIQHRHMLYGELHRHHYLVLDQSASDNVYSASLRHEVWNVDHKIRILGICLCYNKFSYLCVQHQHYLEHITVCLYIFLPWIFFNICSDQWHHFCDALLSDVVGII